LTKPILSERAYQLLMRAIEFEWTDEEIRQLTESLADEPAVDGDAAPNP
jgi:hypothetical protein